MTNWIDARFNREEKSQQGAEGLWQDVVAAIQACCDSFNTHYSHLGSVIYKTTNGHRVVLTVTLPGSGGLPPVKRTVAVDFSLPQCRIGVAVDGGTTQTFSMDSDGHNIFIADNKTSMSVDDFSRRVLEKPLFDAPPKPRPLEYPSSNPGPWS